MVVGYWYKKRKQVPHWIKVTIDYSYIYIYTYTYRNIMPGCKAVQHQERSSIWERDKLKDSSRFIFFCSFSNIEARTFYSYALQRLSGVVRSGKPVPDTIEDVANKTNEPWRPFNRYKHGRQHKNFYLVLWFWLTCWCFSAYTGPGCTWQT